MRKLLTVAIGAFGLLAAASPAHAGAVFVSGAGTDSGTCSDKTTACRTLAYAYSQISSTSTNAYIFVLDPDLAGPLTITKPTAIIGLSPGAALAVMSGDMLTVTAGTSDAVTIIGLQLVTLPGSQNNALNIQTAGTVTLDHVSISGFGNSAINLVPTAGSVRLTVKTGFIHDNLNGVLLGSNGGSSHLKMFDSIVLSNTNAGVAVTGSGNNALFSNTQLLGSAAALELLSGAQAISYGNNVITNGNAPTQVLPLQ